jgi:hypothetical protein
VASRASSDVVVRTCSFAGCCDKRRARGLCNKHLLAQRDRGPCGANGCQKRAVVRGLCNMHYLRMRKTGALGPSHSLVQVNAGRSCVVPDCDQPAKCKGLCRSHMGRFVSRNLSYDSYSDLLREQDNSCAICGRSDAALKIDHDHGHCDRANGCSECVRGLLCSTCNTGLGKFNDDPSMLLKALIYLSERKR